jgi:hypothetical protein
VHVPEHNCTNNENKDEPGESRIQGLLFLRYFNSLSVLVPAGSHSVKGQQDDNEGSQDDADDGHDGLRRQPNFANGLRKYDSSGNICQEPNHEAEQGAESRSERCSSKQSDQQENVGRDPRGEGYRQNDPDRRGGRIRRSTDIN